MIGNGRPTNKPMSAYLTPPASGDVSTGSFFWTDFMATSLEFGSESFPFFTSTGTLLRFDFANVVPPMERHCGLDSSLRSSRPETTGND